MNYLVNKVTEPFSLSLDLPGSKSISLRACVLGALGSGRSVITGVGECDDFNRMYDAIGHLGVEASYNGRELVIEGCGGNFIDTPVSLNVGLSGVSGRFLLALAALGEGPITIDGQGSMRTRPNKYLMDALSELGCSVISTNDGFLPATVNGAGLRERLSKQNSVPVVKMMGDLSSHYFSALLLIAPLLPKGLEIRVEGSLVSKPYVGITINEMRKFGVSVENLNFERFIVSPQKYRATELQVEGDASALSYLAALATLHRSEVRIGNLGTGSVQGDLQFLELMEQLGARVERSVDSLRIVGPKGDLDGFVGEVDMELMPDVAPTLMAMAPFFNSRTRIVGLSTLRIKECDRIAAPAAELRKFGVEVKEGPDWIEIAGGYVTRSFPNPIEVETYHDHRMAMSLSVFGSMVGGMQINDAQVVEKTYPKYWEDFGKVCG